MLLRSAFGPGSHYDAITILCWGGPPVLCIVLGRYITVVQRMPEVGSVGLAGGGVKNLYGTRWESSGIFKTNHDLFKE